MYGNYGYNYYNQNANMQNRLATMDQQYTQQYVRPQVNPMSALSGRIVTGMEEARASQIPLDGTISYFPSPAENKIYVKSIDMQGLPIFLTYELQHNVVPIQQQYVDNSSFMNLQNRVDAIEKALKGETNHESTVNPNVANAQ